MSESFINANRSIANNLIEKINQVVDMYPVAVTTAQKIKEEVNSNSELQTPFSTENIPTVPRSQDLFGMFPDTYKMQARSKELDRRIELINQIAIANGVRFERVSTSGVRSFGTDVLSTIVGQVLSFRFDGDLKAEATVTELTNSEGYMQRVMSQVLKQAGLK